MQRVLPQATRVDSLLSDLGHLGNTAWTTLRDWPNPLRAKTRNSVYRQPPRVTLLVTDLVGFSTLVTALGDRVAHRLIQAHNGILRACLRQHAGREVTHTGDGIIASFGDPIAAARCAVRIQDGLNELSARYPETPLRARIGLHAGRPLPEEGRLFGGCVNYTVRVCSMAAAGQILVSDCVKRKIESQFVCTECAPIRLKGFTGMHLLHALA